MDKFNSFKQTFANQILNLYSVVIMIDLCTALYEVDPGVFRHVICKVEIFTEEDTRYKKQCT